MEHGMEHMCCCNAKADENKEMALGMDDKVTELLEKLKENDKDSSSLWVFLILFAILFGKTPTGSTKNPYDISIVDKLLFHMSEVNIRFK